MAGAGVDLIGAAHLHNGLGGVAQGACGIHHIVKEHAVLALDVADDVHDLALVGLLAALVHNGREETTTFCLIPAVREATTLPLIAAGGVGTGEGILAAMVLGAEGVQIGTRFALTDESSASPLFKEYCLSLGEGDTKLLLKKLAPTRLVKNSFREAVEKAEDSGASMEELRTLLGRGRAKKGIFEGDLEEGELEIGQVSSIIYRQQHVAEVMKELVEACQRAAKKDYL